MNPKLFVEFSIDPPFESGVTLVGGHIVWDSDTKLPSAVVVMVACEDRKAVINGEVPALFEGRMLSGKLEDGDTFRLRLGPWIRQNFAEGGAKAEYHFIPIGIEFSASTELGTPTKWVFALTNLAFSRGDEFSQTRFEDGTIRNAVDTVRFSAANREWTLKDTLFGSNKNVPHALVNGWLETVLCEGDEQANVEELTEDIAFLLAFATGRDVAWVAMEKRDANGRICAQRIRGTVVKPAQQGGSGPILNSQKGELARFLTSAFPVVAANRAWWRKTFDFCLEARASQAIEMALISWNILVDRVSSAALRNTELGNQIHASLNETLKRPDYIAALHETLKSICPGWNQDRSDKVVETIKRWNNEPSFPNKVAMACLEVGAPPPQKSILNRRHKLIHLGELSVKGDEAIEYLTSLGNTVVAILLKLLKYDPITQTA